MRRFAVALVAVLLLAGCGGGDPDAQFNGRKLDKPYDVPDIALTATDGGVLLAGQ